MEINGILLIFLLAALAALWAGRRWQRRWRQRFVRDYRFPAGLDRRLASRYPHLDSAGMEQVFHGLRQYFLLSLDGSRGMLAMPSQVVDQAWHEFILYTRQYQKFCQQAFGTFLHHAPAVEMTGARQQAALRRTWRRACRLEQISPTRPDRLPLLFGIDARLRIADGYHYALDCLAQPRASGKMGEPWCVAVFTTDADSHDPSDSSADSSGDGDSGCGGGCGGGGD